MLLLSGPENLKLRRVPVACLSLLIASLLLSVVSSLLPDYEASLKIASTYQAANPWAEGDPRIDALIEVTPELAALRRDRLLKKAPGDKALEKIQATNTRNIARAMDAMDATLFVSWGFKPMDPSLLDLVLACFVHYNMLHLIPALLLLYLVGPYLEDRWGRVFFPLFYVAGGAVAALGHLVHHWESWSPFFGGNGAMAAVVGAYMVRYRHDRLRFVYLVPILKRETFGPSVSLLFLWLLLMLPIALLWRTFTMYPFVGWLPHLWALSFGALTALALEYFQWEGKLYQSAFEKLPEEERFAITADRLLEEGSPEQAYEHLAKAWRAYPSNPEFLKLFWHQAVRLGRVQEAMGAGKKLIDACLKEGDYDRAHFYWRELTLGDSGDNLPPDRVASLVHGLLSVGALLDAREVMAYTVKYLPQALTHEAMLSLLETARFADPKLAVRVIDRLLHEGERDPALIDEIKIMREELITFHPEAHLPEEERPTIALSPAPQRPVDMEEDPFAPAHISFLKIYPARPLAITEAGLQVLIEGQDQSRVLGYEQMKGLTAAAIRPMGGRPNLALDLLTDDPFQPKEQHRVLRFSGRYFDPLVLFPNERGRAEAARALLKHLLEQSSAQALPDSETLLGQRFPVFSTMEEFHEAVYGTTLNG